MATMKCPCGFDSGYTHTSNSFPVGEVQRKSGLAFIMLQDGDAVWICPTCLKTVNDAAVKISKILKSDYWVAISVLPRDKHEART